MQEPVRKWQMEELELRHRTSSIDLDSRLVLVCDNIRSALNIGSIFRTADAFGIREICLCGISARPPHREILKTALGATETVPWTDHAYSSDAILRLQGKGYRCIGIEQTTRSVSLKDLPWTGHEPLALVFGNEVTGLSEDLFSLLDGFVEIPQFGTKHSLNVAVAAGVVCWELVRRWVNP